MLNIKPSVLRPNYWYLSENKTNCEKRIWLLCTYFRIMQLIPLYIFSHFSSCYLSFLAYQHLKPLYSVSFAFSLSWMKQKWLLCPTLKVDFLKTVIINSVYCPGIVTSSLMYLPSSNWQWSTSETNRKKIKRL